MKTTKRFLAGLAVTAGLLYCCTAWADGLSVINDPYLTSFYMNGNTPVQQYYSPGNPIVGGGTADWLADVRFRNFRDTGAEINQTYEMSVNAHPLRTVFTNPLLSTGDLPGGYGAMWAENNDFWITYDPGANSISLQLVGSGRTSYDVTINRAPDAVIGPVNYIEFSLWDRDAFATLPGGITISSLDGDNLGSFTLPSAGNDSWAIINPGGSILSDGFVLQGSFTVDPAKLLGGTETDKIIFGIGNHSLVPPPVPAPTGVVALCGLGVMGLMMRSRRRKRTA